MKTERLADGRYLHTLRQSSLKTLDICPERARREMTGTMPRVETDAANIGTAAHSAYESVLVGDIDTQYQALAVFHHEFDILHAEAQAAGTWQWNKYDMRSAHAFGELCVTNWYEQVLPTLEPSACVVEHDFDVPLWADEQREIRLSGTIDYWQFPEYGETLWDWKHSSRTHKPWERKRWDIQSTSYSYAADQASESKYDSWLFRFVVMHPKGVQLIEVERGPKDWLWLQHKAISVAKLIEADLDEWVKNEESALCSPVWCPAWDTCRGLALGPDPWGQLKESA